MGVWIETAFRDIADGKYTSHPSWVCGLKQPMIDNSNFRSQSHPSWVCGLKPILWYDDIRKYIVTPFVGVWIETARQVKFIMMHSVTPFVGVWIETDLYIPLRERIKVTPFVGVWIETQYTPY